VTLPWLVRRSGVLLWGDLPRMLALGALVSAGDAPLVASVVLGQPLLAAISALPAAIALTGAARMASAVVAGDRPRVRAVFAIDPPLVLSVAIAIGVGALLTMTGGAAAIVGDALAAVLVVVLPWVAGYAAVRRRPGLAAWRGGLVLVAYQPVWALTLCAFAVIGAFAVVASAGVFAVIVPPFLSLLGVAMCTVLLEEIDERQSR
jgi:hypothetical protein